MTAVLERLQRATEPLGEPRSWDVHRVLRVGTLAALFLLIAWVHAGNFGVYPLLQDDEGTYVAQAWALLERGELSHYTYWYDHPPGGWIVLAAWAWLTDGFARSASAVAMGREVALIATMISSWLLYVLARRSGLRWGWAALAVALFALSPLGVDHLRMVFLDNLVTPWILAVFVLLKGKRSLAAYTGAGVCFALAVLTKLTAGLFLPLVLWELWRTAYPNHRRYAVVLLLGTFALMVSLFPLMALLRGELIATPHNTSLIDGLRFQLLDRQGSGSLLDPDSELWTTLNTWLASDHLLIYAGLLATIPALFFRHVRLYALIVLVHAAMLVRSGYLPVPFIIQVLPYLALVVVGTLDGLWNVAVQARHQRGLADLLRASAAAAVIAAFAVGLLVPMTQSWPGKLQQARTENVSVAYEQAIPWIMENVDPDSNIVVENQTWLELVRAGRPEASTIWFYKPGLDPAVPFSGPEDFDYIVTSLILNSSAEVLPEIKNLLEQSHPVKRFGEGDQFVEIRRIDESGQLAATADVADAQRTVSGFQPETRTRAPWLTRQ
jgi:hypothetical protein